MKKQKNILKIASETWALGSCPLPEGHPHNLPPTEAGRGEGPPYTTAGRSAQSNSCTANIIKKL